MTAEAMLWPFDKTDHCAQIFAALGDRTRLALLSTLARRAPCSIVQLTNNAAMTRQAVTKHLQVLQKVGLVKNTRRGRENLFELKDHPFNNIQLYLNVVAVSTEETLFP